MRIIKITTKDSDSHSITKEIEKPKRKQPLYSKFKTTTTTSTATTTKKTEKEY